LPIGAFEDNDDNDDTATGKCRWVLSIKDKPKLIDLAFKPAPTDINATKSVNKSKSKNGSGRRNN
jgi:hypothetical protein